MHRELTSVDIMAGLFDEAAPPEPPRDEVVDPIVRELRGAVLRSSVEAVGVVTSSEAAERPIRFVDVVVDDGTGQVTCRFFGRRAIGGLEAGRSDRVVGRVTLHLGRECLVNPDYELCDPPCDGVASS